MCGDKIHDKWSQNSRLLQRQREIVTYLWQQLVAAAAQEEVWSRHPNCCYCKLKWWTCAPSWQHPNSVSASSSSPSSLEIRFRKQFSLNNNNNNSTARWMLRIILPKSTTLLVAHYYWDQTSWRFKQMISSYIQIFCSQQSSAISGHRVSFKIVQAKWGLLPLKAEFRRSIFSKELNGGGNLLWSHKP